MKNVGILLRGKSIEKLPLIKDKFNDCYIVNSWKKEIEIFRDYLKNKNIIHCVNSMKDASLTKKQYCEFNIKNVLFAFTKSMYNRKYDIKKYYIKKGIKNFEYVHEKYIDKIMDIKNTGVNCIFYMSEIVKPKIIWIVGLDFYRESYLIKQNASHQLEKSKKIKLIDSFINIVNAHPNINYVIITYFKNLPKLNNLRTL